MSLDPRWHGQQEQISKLLSCLLQVENKNEIFEARRSKPPLIMNEPPVAGAIRWAQFLFQRLKRTILPFLKVPEMLKCELISAVSSFTLLQQDTVACRSGQMLTECLVRFTQAKAKYVEMAMKIRSYEEKKHDQWMLETDRSLPQRIKKPLLNMMTREGQVQVELVCISCRY